MIKIAVFNLGRGIYSAFSINQDYPLSTTIRVNDNASKSEIERIIVSRFHSQRVEWKKHGITSIKPIERTGTRLGGWKFKWLQPSVLWSNQSISELKKTETLISETGLTIVKETPIAKPITEREQMVMAETTEDGRFSFTPLSNDIIAISEIPEYIKNHKA